MRPILIVQLQLDLKITQNTSGPLLKQEGLIIVEWLPLMKTAQYTVMVQPKVPNILNIYFNSVYTEELFHNMPTLVESDYPNMPEIEIRLDGVVSLLQKLKPFEACGSDQILNRILKEIAKEIAPALLLLYRSSFSKSKLPNEWKHECLCYTNF